jgi:hypothetical protein
LNQESGDQAWSTTVFEFLASPLGKFLVGAASIILVVLVKGVIKPTSRPAFQRDDFAVGMNLAVLAIVTLLTGSVADFSSKATKDTKTGAILPPTTLPSYMLLLSLTIVAASGLAFYMQRSGWCSDEEREEWRKQKLKEERVKNPNAVESDLPEAPRVRLGRGIVVPFTWGGLLVFLSVWQVTRG